MKIALLVCLVAFAVVGNALANEEEAAPKTECMCARIYLPVCSTEGKTYGNKCEFQCYKTRSRKAGLKIARRGRCEDAVYSVDAKEAEVDPKSECMCSRIYLPVCSTEKKTYPNKCEFECYKSRSRKAGLKIARQGTCEDEVYV